MTGISYVQASVIGLLQGATEPFPVSSLGYSVLVPALIGGSWQHLVTESAAKTSEGAPYLAFIVVLHVATAAALLVFFRADWIRLVRAVVETLRSRRIETSSQRLGWLIIMATIPVGLIGLLLERTFRTLFAKPFAAAVLPSMARFCSAGSGCAGEAGAAAAEESEVAAVAAGRVGMLVVAQHRRLNTLAFRKAGVIGLFQTLALFAGISRSGITMVAGLLRGLDHEDAALFSFLLATPVILIAGVLKLPSLAGSAGAHIHGQVVVGMLTASAAAYLSVRFLLRYFETRALTLFAIYCLAASVFCMPRFAIA